MERAGQGVAGLPVSFASGTLCQLGQLRFARSLIGKGVLGRDSCNLHASARIGAALCIRRGELFATLHHRPFALSLLLDVSVLNRAVFVDCKTINVV